jgi:hypothetical protein
LFIDERQCKRRGTTKYRIMDATGEATTIVCHFEW